MINTGYLEKDKLTIMKKVLESESVVQLQQGLDEKIFKKLSSEYKKLKFTKKYDMMLYKYDGATSKILTELINTNSMKQFLQDIIGKKIKSIEVEAIRMNAGDYMLIHNKSSEIIIDLNEEWIFEHGGTIMFNDGFGNITRIPCLPNSVIISNGNSFRFVKYLNHNSDKNRELIIGRILE